MILRTWLNELDYELVRGSLDVEVTEVVYDSRKAVPGAVFVCMREPGWIPTGLYRMCCALASASL